MRDVRGWERPANDDFPRWRSWDDIDKTEELGNRGAFSRLPGFRRIGNARARVFAVVMTVVLVLCSLGSLPVILVGASQYGHLSTLGNLGVKHFRTAATLFGKLSQNPFDSATISQAHQELDAGAIDFKQLGVEIDHYPSAFASIPAAGPRLAAVKRLIPIAVQGATAGGIACDALTLLSARLRSPLDATAPGLTLDNLKTLGTYLGQIQTTFDGVTAQIQALSPSDLSVDARIGSAVAEFRAALPRVQKLLSDAKVFLGAAPVVLGVGAPATYLIEVMDSTEIRPGGGFIGNYGTAAIVGGHLSDVHITDVDLLDRPFEALGGAIPKPPQYTFFDLWSHWSFRDSNLDADFPTSAQNGIQTYKTEGGPATVQGAIAITPWLVQTCMRLTGSVTVPEYKETVTADTLVNTIHHHQLGAGHGNDTIPDGESGSSQRKRFTALLFENFFKQLKAVAAKDPSAVLKILINAVRTKDVQIYLSQAAAQSVLVSNHLAATIDAPATGDSLFIVDSNQTPSKANYFMTYTAQDKVTLDANGAATHALTLTYNWPQSPQATANNYGVRNSYRDYLRVFTPPNSQLQQQSGWATPTHGNRFNRAFWAGLFRLNYGASGAVTLQWTVPNAAVKTGQVWSYQYLAQRQAGITWNLDLQITLPACAHRTAPPSGLVIQDGGALTSKADLTTDKTFEVSYSC